MSVNVSNIKITGSIIFNTDCDMHISGQIVEVPFKRRDEVSRPKAGFLIALQLTSTMQPGFIAAMQPVP